MYTGISFPIVDQYSTSEHNHVVMKNLVKSILYLDLYQSIELDVLK